MTDENDDNGSGATPAKAVAHPGERIAKVLARAGIASRREAERLIAEGAVAVNGEVIDSPARNIGPRDRVTVHGRPVAAAEPPRLWLYYKPVGLVTTERDEKGRETVFDALPGDLPRVVSVGRLDLNSEGLLLLTNDGEIKRRLELPSTGWLRKYRVRVNGRPEDAVLDPLRRGIEIEGERFQPMQVTLDRQQGANAWLTVGLREGRNREIRRAMDAVGLTVNRLIRLSYGPFKLDDMEPGEVREVKPRVLRDQLGLKEEDEGPGVTIARANSGRPSRAGAREAKGAARPRMAGQAGARDLTAAADPSASLRAEKGRPAARGAKGAPRSQGMRSHRAAEEEGPARRPAGGPATPRPLRGGREDGAGERGKGGHRPADRPERFDRPGRFDQPDRFDRPRAGRGAGDRPAAGQPDRGAVADLRETATRKPRAKGPASARAFGERIAAEGGKRPARAPAGGSARRSEDGAERGPRKGGTESAPFRRREAEDRAPRPKREGPEREGAARSGGPAAGKRFGPASGKAGPGGRPAGSFGKPGGEPRGERAGPRPGGDRSGPAGKPGGRSGPADKGGRGAPGKGAPRGGPKGRGER